MKNIIFWFSGTGNSLSLATDLAKRLGNTDLIPLASIINRTIPSAEIMGIVFPVYAFGPPLIVKRFIERAPLDKAKYIFSVATMGGLAGSVHAETRQLLASRGAELSAGWSISMPGNYPVLSAPPPPAKQALLFEKAGRRLDEIAAAISGGKKGIYEDTRLPLRWVFSLIRKKSIDRFPEADGHFTVGKNCKHCALCAKVCPVSNIRIAEGNPVWMHHCEQCMACLQWCPVQAIEFGKATVGKPRYHHPRFKAHDFCLREE